LVWLISKTLKCSIMYNILLFLLCSRGKNVCYILYICVVGMYESTMFVIDIKADFDKIISVNCDRYSIVTFKSVLKLTKLLAVPNSLTCTHVKKYIFFLTLVIDLFVIIVIKKDNYTFLMWKTTFFSSYKLLNVWYEVGALICIISLRWSSVNRVMKLFLSFDKFHVRKSGFPKICWTKRCTVL